MNLGGDVFDVKDKKAYAVWSISQAAWVAAIYDRERFGDVFISSQGWQTPLERRSKYLPDHIMQVELGDDIYAAGKLADM